MEFAHRLRSLQSNVFADMDRAKGEAIAQGLPMIDLSLGSSDLPTPPVVLEAIASALDDPSTHGYALFQSTEPFRQAIARHYTAKYTIPIDPDSEVLPLIGCQEGTAHLPLAVLNPGDYALLQDPGYPSHFGGVALAGGRVHTMPLRAEAGFLPQFEEIPAEVLQQARLMVLSYPHNPTTAIASLDFFKTAIAFCERHDLILAHDFPYADLVFEGSPAAPSLLQADPDKTRSIEFFTFSKSYNMGGFRIAYAVGNAEIIGALRQVKAVIDFNQYRGIMRGAIAALEANQAIVNTTVETFAERRDAMVEAMAAIGWPVSTPPATMYIWAQLPPAWRDNSIGFCQALVRKTGVALAPGAGFGAMGEGYVRFALVHPPEVLREAIAKIQPFLG
ncbi:LL-diaminopimelate aminotransferase [Spirulina major CS-329]|uniref:LL-diaminopimelate aminotransferase n=1 Tax=Spirulina TaxID=1154 RepID=UPI0023302454|nr:MULTISPECIES: LL-diaminopimelate aminotransferase [Spirulina]MDB9494105.1 LL-diaminopimelate aminotransferase [Spirulina subsalsa CS-330]MDB9505174.1 LL-diaminopimelate aminotransferase [Spirulina major CS-329]